MSDIASLPSLNALKAFLVTAELGSINAAAHALNVTHGAVSRQIRQLEEQLGTALTEKQGRGIKLTDAGRQLHADTAPALTTIANSCKSIRQYGHNRPLVLACPGSILAHWLIPRLHQLQQDLPGLSLQLITSPDDENPLQPGADASLSFSSNPDGDSVHSFILDHERTGPIVSPDFARKHQLSDSPVQRLLDFSVLYTESRPQAWPDWLEQRLPGETLNMAQGFPHLYYLLEATAAGMGIGIAPQQLVHDNLQQGRLLAPWGFVKTTAHLCLKLHNPRQAAIAEQLAGWLTTHL